MAETMIYTCDICKNSKSKDDLAKITVRAEGIRMKGVPYGGLRIDVCPDCLRKKGFVVDVDLKTATEAEKDTAAAKNKVSLEDKIYEFLADLGVMFEE